MSNADEPPRRRPWQLGSKRLYAGIVAAGTLVGLLTGILTLRDQIFHDPKEDPPTQQQQPPAKGQLTVATAGQLVDDVQLSRFHELLGAPLAQKRLQNDEWLVSTWQSVDIQVQAYSDQNDQVLAYTLTSLSPKFTPIVANLPGGVRLRSSTFDEVETDPTGVEGVYPLNARYYYLEYFQGGGATYYKSFILAASYAANADDEAATLLVDLSCLPYSIFADSRGCSADKLAPLRKGLHVTSVTVGESSALRALSKDGALFHPDPF